MTRTRSGSSRSCRRGPDVLFLSATLVGVAIGVVATVISMRAAAVSLRRLYLSTQEGLRAAERYRVTAERYYQTAKEHERATAERVDLMEEYAARAAMHEANAETSLERARALHTEMM